MNDNKKIATNSIIIFVKLFIVSLVSIISSRIVLDSLGASDYGLYNVVGGIVTLLNVFNSAMSSTTYRYIAFELGQGVDGKPNKIFNVSLAIHICFALTIIIFGSFLGLWYIDNYLNIVVGKIADAKFVFIISVVTTTLSTLLVPYQGLLVAYEKFKVTAIIEVITQLLKLGAIFFILNSFNDRLRLYSLIMLGVTLFSSLSYYGYSVRHYFEIVKLKLSKDIKLYKEMISFAFWTLFGAVANVGKTQGSAVIINLFFGTVVNAAFAVASQVEIFILTFARSLNNAAIPQITKNFSGGNSDRSIKLTSYISKYTFLLMAIVAFPVILEMEFLLNIWLKDVPKNTIEFSRLMIVGALLGCLGEGIPALVNATGRIKTYQIVVNTILLIGLPVTFILYKWGYNPITISVVYCVIFGFIGFVKLYLLHRIVSFNLSEFFKTSYLKILLVSIPLIIFYMIYNPTNFTFLGHIIGLVSSEIFLLFTILIFGFDKDEKMILKKIIAKIKK